MKKTCFILVFALCWSLASAVSSSAGEKKFNVVISPRSYLSTDVSFDQAHVCDAQSFDCRIPERLITSFPVLNIQFYAPYSQFYNRHYIVSDTAGTFAFYYFNSDYVTAGTIRYELDVPELQPGDYTFTAIVTGIAGGNAISEPYRFSIR